MFMIRNPYDDQIAVEISDCILNAPLFIIPEQGDTENRMGLSA